MAKETTATEEVKAVKDSAPKTVEVDKDKLDSLLTKLEEQGKTIEMLVATADKARVARFNQTNATPVAHTYRVRTFKGQVVLGWRSVIDEMYQDRNAVWHERQEVEIVTENGDKFTLPFLEGERLPKVQTTHVGTETKFEDNQQVTVLTLRLEDGREIKINQTYVN